MYLADAVVCCTGAAVRAVAIAVDGGEGENSGGSGGEGDPEVAASAVLASALDGADVVVALGVMEDAHARRLAAAAAACPTLLVLGDLPDDGQSGADDDIDAAQPEALRVAERLAFAPTAQLLTAPAIPLPRLPWSRAAKDAALLREIRGLYQRRSPLDLQFALLLLASWALGERLESVAAADSIGLDGLVCMATKCREPVLNCVRDETCKKALDCLDECGVNDQVCSYMCLRSYESPLFTKFSLCVMQKNNCLNNKATIQELPAVDSIPTWRGEPLTDEAARQIYEGWYGAPADAATSSALGGGSERGCPEGAPTPYSWRVVAGQNPAYDQFPCQYQIFYRGKARDSLWYQPVFRVYTNDGREMWRASDYKCRRVRNREPGTLSLTFSDSGVTSREIWRIAGAADGLEWALFYYAGAAERAGQRYVGAVMASRDGKWPPASEMPAVEAALRRCGIELWEMYEVNNAGCQAPPLKPIHEPSGVYSSQGTAAPCAMLEPDIY